MPVEKQVNSNVFAGTINGNGSLEVKVSKPASDSTIARLIKLVNEGQQQKSPTQRFTDKLQKIFVPVVLISVVLLCFAFLVIDETFSQSFYRAMSVLVAASPCALAISTPSAVLSGVARAAREGVLIKGGRPLEDLGTLTALAFDKTGTLTAGKPRLTNIMPVNGITEEELLESVVAVEALSDHPLAKALVTDGTEKLKGKTIVPAQELEAIQGKGVKAKWQNSSILIGNRTMFENSFPAELNDQLTSLESQGHTAMIVKRDDKYVGIVTMMDTPREEAKTALQQLKEGGIRKMIMLSGDSQQVADAIAKEIGLTDAWGNLLPEQKVEAIKKLIVSEGKVAMVGDGVNDAPAMANSTVGIAMGAAGSDVALETADIALMGDRLDKLPFAIALSRKANGIIKQNLFISLGMVVVLIPLTLLGIATIGPAVMAHEGSTIVVVFNALRLLVYKYKG
jgi:Cd2+/Zn2+-exporting ATPase